MSKKTIPPGQRLPQGALYDKTGKLIFPKNPPVAQVIKL